MLIGFMTLQRIDIVKRDTNIRITDMPRKVYRDVVWYRVTMDMSNRVFSNGMPSIATVHNVILFQVKYNYTNV